MEWLKDSKACLDIAEIMLDEVEELIQESIQHEDVLPYLKVKIKNFLENCRSPLDYSANFIFIAYCKSNYKGEALKRRGKVYFPIIPKKLGKSSFYRQISENWKGLRQTNPTIVSILEECQHFSTVPWLNNLTYLINENKHRNLTKQKQEKKAFQVHNLVLPGNIIIKNATSYGENGPNIVNYNGEIFNSETAMNHPTAKSFEATLYVDYYFTDLQLPVIPTLKQIFEGTKKTINNLEQNL